LSKSTPRQRDDTRRSSLEHWENYYRTGALATCPVTPGSGYTLELYEVWKSFFAVLAEGARILDVGTGNGAIVLIAKEAAAALGRNFEIHGADLAQIDPARDVPDGARLFAGIEFHARVPMERLPFAPDAFDAVSGQYALEYADVGAALAEFARVLKRGGRAQFILHHVDSVIVQNARESLVHADLVLNESKILRKLRRFLESERRSHAAARSSWEALLEAANQIKAAAGTAKSTLILSVTTDAVHKLLNARRQLSPPALERHIAHLEGDLRASVRRMDDLVRVARTPKDVERIKATAASLGFAECEAREQHHGGGNLVGWRLSFRKP
jgi:ubiquinone/menaquinone biosynthesis C-methylase UbiE